MLVLSRKQGERLVIGEDVVVTVNRISGNRITLAIQAPRHVRIVRGELEPKEVSQRGKANAAARSKGHARSDNEMTYLEVDASLFGESVQYESASH